MLPAKELLEYVTIVSTDLFIQCLCTRVRERERKREREREKERERERVSHFEGTEIVAFQTNVFYKKRK